MRMSPSRSREKERPSGPLQPEACMNRSSSSALRTTSFESSPPQTNGESTLQPKPLEKASSTRGRCGSPTTSMTGTSLNRANTLKTRPSLQAGRALKEASCRASIPLSPNYFDVLSEEEKAPPEETLERDQESPGLHMALALSRDPKEKSPMFLQDQAAEKEEADLQLALHLSRAWRRRSKAGERLNPASRRKQQTGSGSRQLVKLRHLQMDCQPGLLPH